ncbi:uncharacterized protein LOC129756902 [Uranotaenia lowii]|uniref:uncharacterized protein LOC129756902 n=1 Tax=Uranotaenia lowii TaxID=190385 RepID=UPI0024789603|nr:uncharacterized protein LOC129756902 [Uranotaenia lowii]
MSQASLLLLITSLLVSTTLAGPIFWFLPWTNWLPSSGSSSSSSSTTSTASRAPINATINLGNRNNTTTGLDDLGTVIDGVTITRSRRSLPTISSNSSQTRDEDTENQLRKKRSPQQFSTDSYIQVGNHVIRLPPGDVSNLTIHIIDGTPTVLVPSLFPDRESNSSGIFDWIKKFFTRD